MSDTVDALVLDLLEWIGPCSRPYAKSSRPGGRRVHACRYGRPLRNVASSLVNLHRKAGPALRFPPPAQSTCASIAASECHATGDRTNVGKPGNGYRGEAALVGPDVWFTILLVSLPSPPRHVNLCDDTPRTPAMAAVSTKSKEPIAMGIRNTPDWSWPGVLRGARAQHRAAVRMCVGRLRGGASHLGADLSQARHCRRGVSTA